MSQILLRDKLKIGEDSRHYLRQALANISARSAIALRVAIRMHAHVVSVLDRSANYALHTLSSEARHSAQQRNFIKGEGKV